MNAGTATTIQELKQRIGEEHGFTGIDEVSTNDIRRKLETYCFSCPLHDDPTLARRHGYANVVAPVTMTPLWAMAAYWSPGELSPWGEGSPQKSGGIRIELATPYAKAVNVGSEWQYLEPLYPGDRLLGTWKLIEVKPRLTSLGEGIFLTTETTIRKQTDEFVAVNRNTLYRYNEGPRRDRATARHETDRRDQIGAWESDWDWSRQPHYATVEVGEELPLYGLPLTYQRIVMSTAVDRMFSGIHHNRDEAHAAGFADIIYNTRGYETLFEITLRRWIGLQGRLTKLGPFRMGASAHPGDTILCRSVVKEKTRQRGSGIVVIELTASTDHGETARGRAEVELPP